MSEFEGVIAIGHQRSAPSPGTVLAAAAGRGLVSSAPGTNDGNPIGSDSDMVRPLTPPERSRAVEAVQVRMPRANRGTRGAPDAPQASVLDSESVRLARIVATEVTKIASATVRLEKHLETTNALTRVILGRLTDATHLTVAETARLKGVTTRTIRNWISRDIYTLEIIPGTRKRGIPVRQLAVTWLPEITGGAR